MEVPSDLRERDKLEVHSNFKYPFNMMASFIFKEIFKWREIAKITKWLYVKETF